MAVMLPSEISEKLSPSEFVKLCSEVERSWHQEFGVVKVNRKLSVDEGKKITVEIELKDNTRHEVILGGKL